VVFLPGHGVALRFAWLAAVGRGTVAVFASLWSVLVAVSPRSVPVYFQCCLVPEFSPVP